MTPKYFLNRPARSRRFASVVDYIRLEVEPKELADWPLVLVTLQEAVDKLKAARLIVTDHEVPLQLWGRPLPPNSCATHKYESSGSGAVSGNFSL